MTTYNASQCRREGRSAYCVGDDPEQVCPYTHISKTYARKCWIEGFNSEHAYLQDLLEEEYHDEN